MKTILFISVQSGLIITDLITIRLFSLKVSHKNPAKLLGGVGNQSMILIVSDSIKAVNDCRNTRTRYNTDPVQKNLNTETKLRTAHISSQTHCGDAISSGRYLNVQQWNLKVSFRVSMTEALWTLQTEKHWQWQ